MGKARVYEEQEVCQGHFWRRQRQPQKRDENNNFGNA